MKAIRLSFFQMLKFVSKDKMLLAALLAPLLAGSAIRFGVPFTEGILTRVTALPAILSPYYGLFVIFFSSITPAMFCFIAAMVVLEERDDHVDRYLFVTGLGRNGYFVSRIGLPALAAFVVTAALLPVFRLAALSMWSIILLSLTGSLQGIFIALLIVALSSNKLEGMAITKLSSLMMLGAVTPYFVPAPVCFWFSFLPSFWVGMAVYESNLVYMLPSVLIAGFLIWALRRSLDKKQ